MRTMEPAYGVVHRLPPNRRLSIPRPKRTLLNSARQWGEPLLAAHQALTRLLHNQIGAAACSSTYKENYSFFRYSDLDLDDEVTTSLYSAALVLGWITGIAVEALPRNTSLSEAEHWFHGGGSSARVFSNELDEAAQDAVLAPLRDLDYGQHFLDILPYACEVFETSDEILKAFGASRKSKRAAGIFYTPSDVADYIVGHTLSLKSPDSSPINEIVWLDPACGTSSLLLSALYKVSEANTLTSSEEAIAYVAEHLFGIDISPFALQSATYTLILACTQSGWPDNLSLRQCLLNIGQSFALRDATTIKTLDDLSRIFPRLKCGADCVVSNPPYIRRAIKHSGAQAHLFADKTSENTNELSLYPAFVRLLPKLAHPQHGAGGMVVPLSIAYSTHREFKALRRFMLNADGSWQLAHFDRTPDSLFGDDVKTRNTIVFFSRKQGGARAFQTSELIRWSSRSRGELFKDIGFAKLPLSVLADVIPKVGDSFGLHLLCLITERNVGTLDQYIARTNNHQESPEKLLRNASTAYNWLPFERPTKASVASTKYHYWAARSMDEASIAFALVQSRLSYWLWRVWGDGFHLTDQFIKSLPLSLAIFSATALGQLKELGDSLWIEMLENKVISRNAGVISYSYCPYVSERLLDQIDELITSAYDLPAMTTQYLKDVVRRTVVAGREDEMTSNPALRRWMSGGKQ